MIERTTISFFGRTNAGKSLLMNRLTSQNVSIVSEIKGTTTDPVKKTMELLPLGPVVFIDTPGIDDDSSLGSERVKKTFEILRKTHIAVLVSDGTNKSLEVEEPLISEFKKQKIPFITAINKCDLFSERENLKENTIYVSAKTGENCEQLKAMIAEFATKSPQHPLVSDLVKKGDSVILVMPIDESAPKDRLILPQQLVIRELLEIGAVPVCCTERSLRDSLNSLKNPPQLVITDSQVFKEVADIIPSSIPLTSFSILMARFKGTLEQSVKGAEKLNSLKSNDTVLISESCTHHRQCKDIGTVKLPSWILSYTKKQLSFEFTSGGTFPTDVSKYALVIHCGGCMANEKEMQSRAEICKKNNVPITNYGTAIALMNGILFRSLGYL